ncbi:hypothetical protein [Magnetospira sp. QH-2]|uniref:hypothetical protein n=1 Tax=Magnetospira sp. (strain QH-2) TaxID=1288970 RepID=UPI0003E8115B|nr:hypothetical protein [Magnetospira sp. QH-2]CCQ75585.1 membrane protein of unknown function [Magnetospira sp. QH-2]
MAQDLTQDFIARNRPSLIRVGLFFGLAVVLAVLSGEPGMLHVLESLLRLGALISAFAAYFMKDRSIDAPTLTRWDEAAFLLILALLFGFLGGPEPI